MKTLGFFSYAIMETLEFFSYAIMETLEFFSYVILKTLGFLRRLLVFSKLFRIERFCLVWYYIHEQVFLFLRKDDVVWN